jgi:aromatic ring-opening dioxygenase catalytic subunit (LigB family)
MIALMRSDTIRIINSHYQRKAINTQLCDEEKNYVCSFSDCPCNKAELKYKSVGQELIQNRFLNEVRL